MSGIIVDKYAQLHIRTRGNIVNYEFCPISHLNSIRHSVIAPSSNPQPTTTYFQSAYVIF